MSYKHECLGEKLAIIIDSIHPSTFRTFSKRRRTDTQTYDELKKDLEQVSEDIELYSRLIESVDKKEKSITEVLFSYGETRDAIIDRLGRNVASCKICTRNYRRFLEEQVKQSKNNPEYDRGAYENIEEADFDFLNIGPSVLKW
jgi:hypothetical protein